MNRTKKALVIDQRFNGGGGIDQELLGILVGPALPVHPRPRRWTRICPARWRPSTAR